MNFQTLNIIFIYGLTEGRDISYFNPQVLVLPAVHLQRFPPQPLRQSLLLVKPESVQQLPLLGLVGFGVAMGVGGVVGSGVGGEDGLGVTTRVGGEVGFCVGRTHSHTKAEVGWKITKYQRRLQNFGMYVKV